VKILVSLYKLKKEERRKEENEGEYVVTDIKTPKTPGLFTVDGYVIGPNGNVRYAFYHPDGPVGAHRVEYESLPANFRKAIEQTLPAKLVKRLKEKDN